MAARERYPVKGKILRDARMERGVTRPEAAQQSGLTVLTWKAAENGENVYLPTLRKFAAWLKAEGWKGKPGDLIDREAYRKQVAEAEKAAQQEATA